MAKGLKHLQRKLVTMQVQSRWNQKTIFVSEELPSAGHLPGAVYHSHILFHLIMLCSGVHSCWSPYENPRRALFNSQPLT